jgi:hypothetical protein
MNLSSAIDDYIHDDIHVAHPAYCRYDSFRKRKTTFSKYATAPGNNSIAA